MMSVIFPERQPPMTAISPIPEKKHRLRDGSMGTQWDILREKLGILKARKQLIEDEIEMTELEMQTAEGANGNYSC